MTMCCLYPDCLGTYCKKCCDKQDEIDRANGFRDWIPMVDRLQCDNYAELNRRLDAVYICKRDGMVNRECCFPCDCHLTPLPTNHPSTVVPIRGRVRT